MSSGNETLSLDLAQMAILLELGRTIAPDADGSDASCRDGGCLEAEGVID